jgi:hypothetical protein
MGITAASRVQAGRVHDAAAGSDDPRAVARTVRFREHFVLGHVVHVHAKWWRSDTPADAMHLCARFHWLFSTPESREAALALDGARNLEPLIEDKHSAVFVDVVDLLQDVGHISGRVSGVSLVWLGPLHLCECSAAGTRSGMPAPASVVRTEVTRLLDAWKQELVVPADDATAVGRRLRADQAASRPTPDDSAVADASSLRDWYGQAGAAFECPIRLEIDSSGAKAFVRPHATVACGFEIVDVFVGPRHFQADGVPWSAHEDSLER